jgi:hypothetical protein
MKDEIALPLSRIMKNATLNVRLTGIRVWWLRQQVGIWLIKCAARVMGVGFFVEMEQSPEHERRDRRQSL